MPINTLVTYLCSKYIILYSSNSTIEAFPAPLRIILKRAVTTRARGKSLITVGRRARLSIYKRIIISSRRNFGVQVEVEVRRERASVASCNSRLINGTESKGKRKGVGKEATAEWDTSVMGFDNEIRWRVWRLR